LGQREGESDLQIARSLEKKWQLGAWLDDAGSKASGRYQFHMRRRTRQALQIGHTLLKVA
jgi:hemolysin activation/secretion protein